MVSAKAVVFTKPNTVEFQDVTCPDPGPGDAVVRVTHSWISNGTEGSFLRGERIQGDTALRSGDPSPFPIVAGYQKIGVVEWVGSDIGDLAIGETVFCAMGKVEGMFHASGGQISPSVAPRSVIWKLPSSPEPLAFSGLVLTQVGYNCGTRAPIEPGEAAVVIGDGMVGQWAAQTLRHRGANVVLVGRHDDRLARFEGGQTVNARDTADWVADVRTAAGGPIAVGVDTVGDRGAAMQALGMLRREGHLVSAGFYGTDDVVSLQDLRQGEKSVDSVSGWTKPRMDATLEWIAAGHLETLPLITHHFPAARAADAWRMIQSKSEDALGVILDW